MNHRYLDGFYPSMPALSLRLGYPDEALSFGSEIILGRNVLNRLRLLLDGPRQEVQVAG